MTKEQFVKLMTVIKDRYDTMNNIIDKLDDVLVVSGTGLSRVRI